MWGRLFALVAVATGWRFREIWWLTSFELEDIVMCWRDSLPTQATQAVAPRAFVDPDFKDMRSLAEAMGLGGKHAAR